MYKTKLEAANARIKEQALEIDALKKTIVKQVEQQQEALHQTRHYYENILALMPGHVYWLDRDSTFLGCNNLQASTLKLKSRHDIVGKSPYHFVSTEEAAALCRVNRSVMETGKQHAVVEYANMGDEEGVYFSQKVPLYNEASEVIGLLGISIDITELKQTEKALIAAKEEAEAANEAKTKFMANMSHDIRTPLTGIIGFSKLLRERLADSDQQQFADWIFKSGQELLKLLNSILDMVSKDDLDDQALNKETFLLEECIQGIMELEKPAIQLKGLDFELRISKDVPRYVNTDRVKLHRILLNLLSNAIKFTLSGSIIVEIACLEKCAEKVTLQIRIKDTGIGIPEDYQDKVFDRFFRVDPSYHGVYPGQGLGLHIAKRYIELLGGSIALSSEPEKGTTFYVNLLVEADNKAIRTEAIQNIGLNELPLSFEKPPHLLLVEDNQIALRMIEIISVQLGCRHTSATHAGKALTLMKSMPFDLVITDVGLADYSGPELVRRIRLWEQQTKKNPIPIIGLTAHALTVAKQECLESGMNDLLTKPMDISTMKQLLQRYIMEEDVVSDLTEQDNKKETHCEISSLSTPIARNNQTKQRENPGEHADVQTSLGSVHSEKYPLFDPSVAQKNIGHVTLVKDVLTLMVDEELPKEVLAIEKAYAATDWKRVAHLAHKLKGAAVYCGATRLQHLSHYFEMYYVSGKLDHLDKLTQQLIDTLHKTRQFIRGHLEEFMQ